MEIRELLILVWHTQTAKKPKSIVMIKSKASLPGSLDTSSYHVGYRWSKHNYRTCWVCYGTDGEDFEGINDWVSPCKCCGSTKWVHQACVQRWVQEKLHENYNITVHCPQCTTEYITIYSEVNYYVRLLNKIDHVSNYVSPFLLYGVLVCSFYCSAVSFGAITVMQVIGEQQVITIMEDIGPFKLLLMLPVIPLSLIMAKAINWENTLLLCLQRFTQNFPLLRNILPSFLCEPDNVSTTSGQISPIVNLTTTLCAALLLPTTSTIVGRLLFHNASRSSLRKTLLGGLVFITVKGVLNIYRRQQNTIRDKTRIIVDYPDT